MCVCVCVCVCACVRACMRVVCCSFAVGGYKLQQGTEHTVAMAPEQLAQGTMATVQRALHSAGVDEKIAGRGGGGEWEENPPLSLPHSLSRSQHQL